MNPINFDWLNQLASNGENDGGNILGSLDLETSNMARSDTGDDQDLVQYLFDSAQFSTTLDSSVSQPGSYSTSSTGNNSSGGSSTDSDSPRSTASSTMNLNNTTTIFDNTWLTSVNPQSSFTIIQTKATPTSSAPSAIKKPSSSTTSRRIRSKKKREPIFVTESPQNAYKKKGKKPLTTSTIPPNNLPSIDENEQHHHHNDSSSPSSHYDDDTMDMNESLEMQHLTSKERRQLRNKISARNFRVRRKEYINELENKVDEQEDEIDKLKQNNKQLSKLNEQLVQEVMQLRMQQQQQSPPPESQAQPSQIKPQQQPLTISPPTSDTNSPPDLVEYLLDYNLFNNNTYLSHTLMPDFDLSNVLNDKLTSPPSTINLEQHRELMTMYPLLAPALASIVIRHTFTLHYVSYLTNYNTTRPKNEVLDIMHPDDWFTAISSNIVKKDQGDDGRLLSSHLVEQHSATRLNNEDIDNEAAWIKDFEKKLIRHHYPYYAFMRLRGFSHEQIMQRCKACMEGKLEAERQRRRKAAKSCSKSQAFHGFTSVAAALLRNPSRSPMIAGVINDTKACRLTPKNGMNKATLLVTTPLRAALRIGGGKS